MGWFETHLKPRLVAVLERPQDLPFAVIGSLVVGIHKVFFSWWLDRRLTRRNNRRFAQAVKENLRFLFSDYGAQLVSNKRPTPSYFDWAQATIVTDGLWFRFARDRGMVSAAVAPKYAPDDWQDLSAVLTAITVGDSAEQEIEFTRLPTIARELEPRMSLVAAALSLDRFEQTKAAASNIIKRRHIQARLRLRNELSEKKKRLGLW